MKLYEQLCQPETLRVAWETIYRKGAVGGIDRTTTQAFASGAGRYLGELAKDLQTGAYVPEPYLKVPIPKKGDRFRVLGLPTVRDKVVQLAVKDLLEPQLEPGFLDVSYAYRKNKGTYKAVQRVRHLIRASKMTWLAACDIRDFFDQIDHTLLLQQLRDARVEASLVHLIELWIGMARLGSDLKWKPVQRGVPQGNILSPLLSNLYLHPLDQWATEAGYGLVRYADDFVLLLRDEQEAQAALKQVSHFLQESLKLKLHPDQGVQPVQQGFDFLGVHLKGTEVSITPDKLEKLKHTLGRDLKPYGKELHRDYLGKLKTLGHYYGRLLPQPVLQELDATLIEVLTEHGQRWLKRRQLQRRQVNAHLFRSLPFFSDRYRKERKQRIADLVRAIKQPPPPPPKPSPEPAKPSEAQAKIAEKKKEYDRKAAAAREVVITTPGVFLGKARGQLVIRQQGKPQQRIPIKQVRNLTIQSRGTTISSDVLHLCVQHGITVDFLYPDGKPYGKFMTDKGLSGKLGLAQLRAYDDGKGLTLARAWVDGKIRNQLNLVKYFEKYNRSQGEDSSQSQECIERMMAALKRAQALEGQDLDQLRVKLMATEAQAAAAYWQYVQDLLSSRIHFPGRRHQEATDPVNQAFNYGYGILYGRVWEAIAKARLHVGLSYLHSPGEERKPTLTFDLIEEFRAQAVDRPVLAMIRRDFIPRIDKKTKRLQEESRKKVAQEVLKRLSRTEKFRGKTHTLQEIILIQGRTLAQFLSGQLHGYRCYIRKW